MFTEITKWTKILQILYTLLLAIEKAFLLFRTLEAYDEQSTAIALLSVDKSSLSAYLKGRI